MEINLQQSPSFLHQEGVQILARQTKCYDVLVPAQLIRLRQSVSSLHPRAVPSIGFERLHDPRLR